jgi:hypothetical protein
LKALAVLSFFGSAQGPFRPGAAITQGKVPKMGKKPCGKLALTLYLASAKKLLEVNSTLQ